MKKIVVLISGSGSNLQSILDGCSSGDIDGRVAAVISNKPDAFGLQRARKYGADAICINHKDFDGREPFDAKLAETIDQYAPDLVVLAGFMRILTEGFVQHYSGRMINIHPSLLPKYTGLNTHHRAIDAGEKWAGATVHYVTPVLDGGPLIAQVKVPVMKGDEAKDLAKRVLSVEHLLYPTVVQWICEDRLTLAEDLPILDGKPLQIPVEIDNTSVYEDH